MPGPPDANPDSPVGGVPAPALPDGAVGGLPVGGVPVNAGRLPVPANPPGAPPPKPELVAPGPGCGSPLLYAVPTVVAAYAAGASSAATRPSAAAAPAQCPAVARRRGIDAMSRTTAAADARARATGPTPGAKSGVHESSTHPNPAVPTKAAPRAAPAIAALVGAGVVELWKLRSRHVLAGASATA